MIGYALGYENKFYQIEYDLDNIKPDYTDFAKELDEAGYEMVFEDDRGFHFIDLKTGSPAKITRVSFDSVALNENQRIVLEALKEKHRPGDVFERIAKWFMYQKLSEKQYIALAKLTDKEKNEVLQAYAEWGLSQ